MGAPQYEQAGADVAGTGTANYVAKWTGGSTLGNSIIFDNGTNVGIGTASPNKKLQVVDGASGEVRFTTTANVAGNTITQRFSSNAAAGAYEGGGAYIQAIQGAGIDIWSLAFGTANVSATSSEQMRITSTGSVGIGTASPLWKNHTVGAGLLLSGTAYNLAAVNQDQTTYRGVSLGYDSSGQIGVIASTGASSSLAFWTNNAGTWGERMRIDSSGNVILNTANTGATIQAAGSQQGLKLPATPGNADAQTLDCYLDGGAAGTGGATWTPTVTYGTGGTVSTTTATGRYVRIGTMIFFALQVDFTVTSAPTGGDLSITLPTGATGANINQYVGTGAFNSLAGGTVQGPLIMTLGSAATSMLVRKVSATGLSQIASQITASSTFVISGSYHAA
jgi:hypothetical protein